MKRNKKGNTVMIVLIVVFIVAIVGFALYSKVFKKTMQDQTAAMSPTNTFSQQQNDISPTGIPTNSTSGSSSNSLTTGNDNANLDKDLQTIGGKINSVTSSSTDVDTSIQNQQADTPTGIQ